MSDHEPEDDSELVAHKFGRLPIKIDGRYSLRYRRFLEICRPCLDESLTSPGAISRLSRND